MAKNMSDIIGELSEVKVGEVLSVNLSTPHPLYNKNKEIWKKCRDAVGGQEEIKEGATKYLPKLNGQTDPEYTNYLDRAQWFGATSRSKKAYIGMLFRKSPQLFFDKEKKEEDKEIQALFDSISSEGQSLTEFAQEAASELIDVNRCGVLVEFPTDEDALSSVSAYEYEKTIKVKNITPVISMYPAESIVNWGWKRIGKNIVPMFFVLKESEYDSYDRGTLSAVKTDIYRVLVLEPFEGSYRYKQIECEPTNTAGTSNKQQVSSISYPLKEGRYLPFIPFFVFDDQGLNFKTIKKPMINDLSNTNIGHFKNSADWENELHIVGHKTLFFPGWDKKLYGNPKIGGALAGPINGEPKMIEASSDSGIRTEMDKKKEEMAVLGSEVISSGASYIASVDTARVANSSESSTLTLLSKSLSKNLTAICRFVLAWARKPDPSMRVIINTDFFQDDIKGSELLEFMKAYQQGGISWDTYFETMKKKELYKAGTTSKQEKEAIEKSLEDQFNMADEKYLDVLEKIASIEADVQATITSSSSGQTLLSMSTGGGGSNISTSTSVKEGSMDRASARNNETPGSSNASAKKDSDENKVGNGKDPNKKKNNDDSKVE